MPSRVAQLELARHQRELILKPSEAHVFGAGPSAPMMSSITTGDVATLAELPPGWFDYGLIDKADAIVWAREMEKSDINAIGYSNPVRSDITSDVFSLAFKGLETNRHNIETGLQVDLSGVQPEQGTGEVSFDQPAVAQVRRGRFLTLARSGYGADAIYIGRLIAAGEVAETGEQTITDGEGALAWPATVNAMIDTAAGFSVRHFFGGPGWKRLLVELGFPPVGPETYTLTESPAGSGLYGFTGLTEDPPGSGLYAIPSGMTESPAGSGLYTIGA